MGSSLSVAPLVLFGVGRCVARRWRKGPGLRLVLLLAPLLFPAPGLLGEPVPVPGGPAAIRRLLGLGERLSERDLLPDLSRALLSGSDPHASWENSERRRAVVSFAQDLAEWKAAPGCPAILSTRPEAWDRTRRALEWLGYRVRGEGPGFSAAPRADAESTRRQTFLDVLGQPSSEALRRLAAGEDVTVSCQDGEAELPFGLAAWRETLGVDEKRLSAANAFLYFVKSVPASRMMWALHAVDGRTREELRSVVGPPGGYGGWKLVYDEALDGFVTYPEALEIRGGRIRLPGGEAADPAWEEVVGTPPSDRAKFIVKLFDAGGGKAAYVADALGQLPEETGRAFVLGTTGGGEPAAERFRHLYDAVSPGGRSYRSTTRDAYDLTHLSRFLTLSDGGEIVPPGGTGLWLEALSSSKFPADEAELGQLLADASRRTEGPDELLGQLLRREVAGPDGSVPARKPFITVSSLIRARPLLADPGSILLLFRGHERLHSGYALLEDLPLLDPAIVRKYLFTLDRLDTNGVDRDAELRAGLFQASAELLGSLYRSGSLPDPTARELFRTLLDVPMFARPRTEISSGIADLDRWLRQGLIGVLREEEGRFLGKMRTEALARDPEDEGPQPARTADGLVASALAGWRAPVTFSWRGGAYLYDPTADGAARRRAFAATQEHASLEGLADAAAAREKALDSARRGDAAATLKSVGALLEGLGAIPPGREADERIEATAGGARHTFWLLHPATGGGVLQVLQEGIERLDVLLAERTLEALAVHVYSSGVLEPEDLPFTDALLVKRHSYSWLRRPGVPVSSPFDPARIESKTEGAPLRLAGSVSGLAEPLGLLHADGLVYDARSSIANDGVRAGLVVPVALLTPARLDDDVLGFVALACRATEQFAAAVAGLPEARRYEAWDRVARDLVPASRRNLLAEQASVEAAEYLSPSDLLRIGRRLALRADASLPRVPAALEASEAWGRLAGRLGEAGASARVAELGPRPFHWAGLGRLSDVDLPSYERLAEYRRPQFFADHLYDLKVAVARSVVEAGDPAALVPLFLEPALDGLLRRARMAFAFDWRSVADRRSFPAVAREDVFGAALAGGRITRAETPGKRCGRPGSSWRRSPSPSSPSAGGGRARRKLPRSGSWPRSRTTSSSGARRWRSARRDSCRETSSRSGRTGASPDASPPSPGLSPGTSGAHRSPTTSRRSSVATVARRRSPGSGRAGSGSPRARRRGWSPSRRSSPTRAGATSEASRARTSLCSSTARARTSRPSRRRTRSSRSSSSSTCPPPWR